MRGRKHHRSIKSSDNKLTTIKKESPNEGTETRHMGNIRHSIF